jgi:hypothetical protein
VVSWQQKNVKKKWCAKKTLFNKNDRTVSYIIVFYLKKNMQIVGQGFHRSLRLTIDIPSNQCDKNELYDLFILLEIQKNSYYFDFYELEVSKVQ